MATKSRKGRSSSSVNVDLSGVEVSRKAIPEGTYEVVVNEAKTANSREGNPMIAFEFEVAEGAHKGAKLYENCSLQPQALFKLKSVLLALGMDIPNKAFDLNLRDLVGLTCEVEVGHEVYEGKKRARILQYNDPEEVQDEDSDEEEGKKSVEDKLDELDLDELKDLAKDLDISASDIKKAKKAEALIDLIIDSVDEEDILEALGEDSDEEDEDDEEGDQDYSEMSLSELKAECKDRGLRVKKGMDKDDLIEMLEEDDEE